MIAHLKGQLYYGSSTSRTSRMELYCRLSFKIEKSLVHLYCMPAYASIMQVLKLSDIYHVGSKEGFRGIKYFYVIHFWSSYNSGLGIYFL